MGVEGLGCPLTGWAFSTLPLSAAPIAAVGCCHPAAAADRRTRLEIETARWAPELFPLLCCCSAQLGTRLCCPSWWGLSRRKPGMCHLEVPGLALAGAPWGDHPCHQVQRLAGSFKVSPLSAAASRAVGR